jgi:hypothetical protein
LHPADGEADVGEEAGDAVFLEGCIVVVEAGDAVEAAFLRAGLGEVSFEEGGLCLCEFSIGEWVAVWKDLRMMGRPNCLVIRRSMAGLSVA